MTSSRSRAPVLKPVLSLTPEQHAEIKRLALAGSLDWSTTGEAYGTLIANFRGEVKAHYYRHQRRRCCYCSVELQNHKLTYDAEHILDKDTYPEYMFDERNLAAACKFCNQHKSSKAISASGQRFVELSTNKDAYSIVHPHLDEWEDHLKFDMVGRIVAKDSDKGRETIRVCRLSALNAVRLADEFAVDDYDVAETALRTFHEISDLTRKRELVSLLGELAERFDHPGSRAAIEVLEDDLIKQELALLVADSNVQLNFFNATDSSVSQPPANFPALSHSSLEQATLALPPPSGVISAESEPNPN